MEKTQISKNDVIAIGNQKSVRLFALMLASVQTGIIYTNIDSSAPAIRTIKMLEKANPKIFFTDEINSTTEEIKKQFTVIHIQSISFDSLKISNHSTSSLIGSDPVYIMFTSGSTGFPKGAVMSQHNILNLINWAQEQYNFNSDEIFTGLNPIYFDNAVFDFYASLFNGLSLAIFKQDELKNVHEIIPKVEKMNCTSWFSVPSLLVFLLTMRSISKDSLPKLKRFIFGGEGFPKAKLKSLYDLVHPQIELHNVYGPTECTCICSSWKISDSDFENMNELPTLGFLAPNFSYVLKSRENNSLFFPSEYSEYPQKGELLLYGPNVGLGYFNDFERSRTSFPEIEHNGLFLRMYTTGDFVEVDNEGKLHFKGRVDNQIKYLGYRIEPEEIEAAFQSLEEVCEVCVVLLSEPSGIQKIVAFVSVHNKSSITELKSLVQERLPVYMIPEKIIVLDQLPKNNNGKIDRKALQNE